MDSNLITKNVVVKINIVFTKEERTKRRMLTISTYDARKILIYGSTWDKNVYRRIMYIKMEWH